MEIRNPGAQCAFTEIIDMFALFHIFHQRFLRDHNAFWRAGGTGGVLQVHEIVVVYRCDDVWVFPWGQTVCIQPFQGNDL